MKTIITTFLLLTLFIVNCFIKSDPKRLTEKMRTVAYHEFLNDTEYNSWTDFKDTYNLKYTYNNSMLNDKELEYLKKNKYIPDFIKKGIIENQLYPLMTVPEFYLAIDEPIDSFIIVSPVNNQGNWMQIGYKRYLIETNRLISNGPVFWFKNGFLWYWGQA